MKEEIKEYLVKVKSTKNKAESRHKLHTIEGRDKANGHILWSIKFDFFGETLTTTPQNILSTCLDEIRKEIEPKGFRIGVKWAEIGAHQSGMLSDMSAGSLMYYQHEIEEINKKQNHSGGYPTHHILEEADFKNVVTLETQHAHMNKWRAKRYEKLKPKRNWIQRILNL